MSGHSSAEEVGRLGLFSGLSPNEHWRLAALTTVEHYSAGTSVFLDGDPPGDLYVILEGRVTLCIPVIGRPETCVLSLRAGELLGWSALLRRRRVATARVVRPSRLLRLSGTGLLALCEEDHHVGYAIMRAAFAEMADRLQATRLQMLDIFGKPKG